MGVVWETTAEYSCLLYKWRYGFYLFQVNDTLDDIFNDSDEEQESQDIVNQVLDEIGIEISGKVGGAGWYFSISLPLLFK